MSTVAPSTPFAPPPAWDRVQQRALMVAAAGLGAFIVLGLILYFLPNHVGMGGAWQFFLSYLVAFNFWISVPLGCLVMLMVQYLTGGAWGMVLRRVLESGSRTLLVSVVLVVPILIAVFLGDASVYKWAHPTEMQADEELPQKALYLNPGFFVVRALLYFAIWIALSYVLNRWSTEQDQQAGPPQRRFRLLSAPGLVLYGLTITFASVDWLMSLEPHWYSTIYPVVFAAGHLLSGFAFAVAVLMILAPGTALERLLTPEVRRDLGNLLLAFVMFWAYVGFSQYLLIWVGNLPEEIPWTLRRTRGGWQWIGILLVLFQFAIPFVLLLSRDVKESGQRLLLVALGLFGMRFLDVLWWVEPAYPHEGQYFYWLLDVAATIGVGGLFVWAFVWQLKRRPLLPPHDPYLAEALGHE
jgi:hypothetical protein